MPEEGDFKPTKDPSIDERKCHRCGQFRLSWTVSSFMTCERCKGRLEERERCAKIVEHFTGDLWPEDVQLAAYKMHREIRES